jgi:hypothetical protein
MIEEHNKIIEEKGLFEEDYEFNWFRVDKNFHKCFLFILCWFIWSYVLFTCWYCMGGILEFFYWLLVGLELGQNNMEVLIVDNWATIPLT